MRAAAVVSHCDTNTRLYPRYRGMGTRLGTVSKFGNRTRTRATRFEITAGKPVPVAIPTNTLCHLFLTVHILLIQY